MSEAEPSTEVAVALAAFSVEGPRQIATVIEVFYEAVAKLAEADVQCSINMFPIKETEEGK